MNIDEMEELEKSTTTGPWEFDPNFISVLSNENNIVARCYSLTIPIPQRDNNALFIVKAKSFVPLAIKRIRELEEYEWKYKELCK